MEVITMSYKSEFHQAIAYIYPAFDPDYFEPGGTGKYAAVCIDFGFERERVFKNIAAARKWVDKTGVPYRLHNELKEYF